MIPVLRDAHLRRQHFDEIAETHQGRPAAADVAVEAERLVLRQYKYAAQIAIQAIRKGDVDDAVDAAERDGRFGAVARERPEPLALAAGQEDTNRIAHERHERRYSSAVRTGLRQSFCETMRRRRRIDHWGRRLSRRVVAAPWKLPESNFRANVGALYNLSLDLGGSLR